MTIRIRAIGETAFSKGQIMVLKCGHKPLIQSPLFALFRRFSRDAEVSRQTIALPKSGAYQLVGQDNEAQGVLRKAKTCGQRLSYWDNMFVRLAVRLIDPGDIRIRRRGGDIAGETAEAPGCPISEAEGPLAVWISDPDSGEKVFGFIDNGNVTVMGTAELEARNNQTEQDTKWRPHLTPSSATRNVPETTS